MDFLRRLTVGWAILTLAVLASFANTRLAMVVAGLSVVLTLTSFALDMTFDRPRKR